MLLWFSFLSSQRVPRTNGCVGGGKEEEEGAGHGYYSHTSSLSWWVLREREGGREGGREGERERGREGGREGEREGGREGGREGERAGEREERGR